MREFAEDYSTTEKLLIKYCSHVCSRAQVSECPSERFATNRHAKMCTLAYLFEQNERII